MVGRYRLVVDRPFATKPGFFRTEWLGAVDKDDIVAEAWALLRDPRDTIAAVKVWDERHGEFLPLTFAKMWHESGTYKLQEIER